MIPNARTADRAALEGWGRERNGLKRSRCLDCRRTFNPLTGTALAGLRKKERWLELCRGAQWIAAGA